MMKDSFRVQGKLDRRDHKEVHRNEEGLFRESGQ
jgi:hypothetical protein